MNKNAWILLAILLCVACLVSCGKRNGGEEEKGELVRIEACGEPWAFFPPLDHPAACWYNIRIEF